MPRLFWKIFGWFWGAMILIGLAMWTVVLTTRPDPMPPEWRRNTASALSATAMVMISEWERDGGSALRLAQRSAQRGNSARFRLLDAKGERLIGTRQNAERLAERLKIGQSDAEAPTERSNIERSNIERSTEAAPNLPARADAREEDKRAINEREANAGENGQRETNARGAERREQNAGRLESSRFFDPSSVAEVRARFRAMMVQASESREPVFAIFGTRAIVAMRETGASGTNYILLADLPRPEWGRPAAAARTQLIGGGVALLLSGLVCWGLVRYLTAPLISLRGATRQLAAGDLGARTGAARSRRHDEVADLGRDFDVMAGRIENLVEGQRQLLGDISHELRSPLARLRMASALGRRQIESGASGAEFSPAFERVTRETARLDALIGQLLDLTRLENGGRGALERVDVTALVREIAADARFEAQSQNKRVEIVRADAFEMQGERTLLSSAIENVVRNALRHTPDGASVEIALTESETGAQIRVRDYGPGVPPETLERIFEPFFRVEEARDRQSGGAGLGLAIVQRALNAHGGEVSARNREDGGLEVSLELPIAS